MDCVKRSLKRRDRHLGRMDMLMSSASSDLSRLESDLKITEEMMTIQNQLAGKEKFDREERRALFDAGNPYHLRSAYYLADPDSLLKVYSRKRNFVRMEDEIRHRLVHDMDDDLHKIPPLNPMVPIPTRDNDGLRIINGLEVWKKRLEKMRLVGTEDLSLLEEKDDCPWRSREDEKVEFLFNRNWPLIETRCGKSVREFAK